MSTLIQLSWSPARGARDGGVERYGRWLHAALEARGLLSRDGVRFGLKCRQGGEVIRTGDGVSAVWVRACERSAIRWARHVARERAAVQGARAVVAISPMVADELAAEYGRRDAAVLLNPVFAPPCRATERVGVCFVGHGFRRKGLDRWLEVMRTLPGVPGAVVGTDHRLAGWRRRARRMGLDDRVCFHGAVDAGPVIAGAALLLHPARYEPYGNVVAEAVASGTPAVASDATGAACLLDPAHVWAQATGAAGLRATVLRALAHPAPPRRRPPSADAHLDALLAVLAR